VECPREIPDYQETPKRKTGRRTRRYKDVGQKAAMNVMQGTRKRAKKRGEPAREAGRKCEKTGWESVVTTTNHTKKKKQKKKDTKEQSGRERTKVAGTRRKKP